MKQSYRFFNKKSFDIIAKGLLNKSKLPLLNDYRTYIYIGETSLYNIPTFVSLKAVTEPSGFRRKGTSYDFMLCIA